MIKSRAGFMLLEAILTVVIVSICLTFIAQSILTNFRTGVRFQEAIRSLIVMENQLGLLYATSGSDDMIDSSSRALEVPYDKFMIHASPSTLNDHLKNVGLILNWPAGHGQGELKVETIIYNSNEHQSTL